MSGGGTAPAMKMSDVFILVSISILVGAFIMHSWVDPISISNDNPHAMNTTLSDGDEVEMQFTATNATTVLIELNGESIEEIFLLEDAKESYLFEVEKSGDYSFVISTEGDDDSSITEVVVSIDRQLMMDKLVYPVGVLLLIFGLYKRKEEKEMETLTDQVIDAELES